MILSQADQPEADYDHRNMAEQCDSIPGVSKLCVTKAQDHQLGQILGREDVAPIRSILRGRHGEKDWQGVFE